MPGFDRTGPLGRGPMTGWGRGWCMTSGAPVPQQESAEEKGTEQIPVQPAEGQVPPLYGLGRGGIPPGCGRGFGGGMRGSGRMACGRGRRGRY